jgi:UDPglucose 6-dehydrogenase
MERARAELGGSIHYCGQAEEVADGADAVLILTEWPQFRRVDWAGMRARMSHPLVLDGRNLFVPGELEGQGLEYHGIGRRAPRRAAAPLAA